MKQWTERSREADTLLSEEMAACPRIGAVAGGFALTPENCGNFLNDTIKMAFMTTLEEV